MNLKKKNLFTWMVAAFLAIGLAMSQASAAGIPQTAVAQKKIAFLPVLQVPMERETPISQILTRDVLEFAGVKSATFVDDALLTQALEKYHYLHSDVNKPLDLALIKRIQQELGADLVVAVRVESLSQDDRADNSGSASVLLVRPAIKMQLVAASAGQAKAWLRALEMQEVVDYSHSGDLGPERLASQKFNSFLQAAWRKL